MQKVGNFIFCKKAVGLLCALVLILTSVYLPALAVGDSFTVSFVKLDGTTTTQTGVVVGDVITYPELKGSRMYDVVWSTSADERIYAPDTLETAADLSVYEYQDHRVQGFEATVTSSTHWGMKTAYNTISQSSDYAYAGKKSIKFTNNENVGYSQSNGGWGWKQTTNISLGNVVANTSYKMTFKYYVPEGNTSDIIINLFAGANGNPSAQASYNNIDADFTVSKEKAGEWLDASYTFTTASELKGPQLNMYLYTSNKNSGTEPDTAVVYIDEISYSQVRTATFVKADGTSSTQGFAAGETITYPKLTVGNNQYNDPMWSAAEGSYSPVPLVMPGNDLTVYQYNNSVIGCETPAPHMISAAKSITQSNEQVYTGLYAYKFTNSDKVTAYSGWGHRTGNSIYLSYLESNTGYRVSFKYFVPEGNEDTVTVVPFTGGSANPNNIGASYNSVVIDNSTAGVWLDKTVEFTTGELATNRTQFYLYFYATGQDNTKTAVVYIDDIEVKKLNKITFVRGYGDSDIVLHGVNGDEIKVPSVINADGRPFLGWYADEALTVPFTDTVFSAESTVVYAKWGEIPTGPIEFDNYVYSADYGYSFGSKTLSIVNEEGIGIEDDYALKFTFDGDAVYQTNSDGTEVKMSTRASQPDHTAAIGKVNAGSIYKVSFWYKTLAECETGYSFILRTASKGNVWAHAVSLSDTRQYIGADESEWKEMVYYFVAEPVNTTGNVLFLQMNSTDRTDNAYVEALVDRISVKELSGGVVYFHGNAEGLNTVIVNAEAGSDLPDPGFKYGANKLLGWYTDKECTTAFTGTTVPEGITHIYAKWSEEPITFENYVWTKENGVAFGDKTLSVIEGEGVGYDDNYVLRFKFKADTVINEDLPEDNDHRYLASRFAQRDHLARVGKVENGELYRITYYYKQMASNCYVTVRPVSAVGGNAWVSYTSYGSTANLVLPDDETITDGEWKKAVYYFTADVKGTGGNTGNTLFLQFGWSTIDLDNYGELYVDSVTLEKIERPYIFFETNNGEKKTLVQGKAGENIVFPSVSRFGHTFTGWYTDEDCTTAFKETAYTPDMAITLYAGWKALSQVTYNYETFNMTGLVLGDAQIVSFNKALSGNQAVKMDRTGKYNGGGSYFAVVHDKEIFTVDPAKKYVVTFNYYMEKAPSENFNIYLRTGKSGNYWAGNAKVSETHNILSNAETGVWLSKSIVLDSTEMKEDSDRLYIGINYGKGGIIYFDDVTVTEIPAGYSAVMIENGGCASIPSILVGKVGARFSDSIPVFPKRDGKYFKGYYITDSSGSYTALEMSNMIFGEEPMTVYARFYNYTVTQNFDDDYKDAVEQFTNFTVYDFDYELYDSLKEGNSKDNVTSGRYSLHRKGTSPYFENAVLLTFSKQIAEGQRYTITFNVRMGEHLHTDGAVKIVSGRTYNYAWATTGDYYPVVAIADLTDGAWHKVTYTFNSVEPYLCIQTPGYVELFIDDVELNLVDGMSVPLSNPATYTEYVPAHRDEKGNVISTDKSAVDISTIIDTSLFAAGDGSSAFNILYVIIPAAAVLVAAAAVLIIVLVKKKSKKA